MNQVFLGDCLEIMKSIPDGSIDAIITDPPYGTIKGMGGEIEKYKLLSQSNWDNIISTKDIFDNAERVLRMNGCLILFSQEPYTSQLITQAHGNLPFSYRMVWKKDHFANCLVANKAPVSYYEDIIVFFKTYDTTNRHPLRIYVKNIINFIGKGLKQINTELGHRKAEHFFYIDSTQFDLCTEKTYNELVEKYGIDNMEGFKEYSELQDIQRRFNRRFNLWEGKKYKSNVLEYKKDYEGLHPTQKPVLLLEDLVKTYTQEGEIVLDFTAGSGTTGLACQNTNRNYILIEKDEGYFNIINQRLNKSLIQ